MCTVEYAWNICTLSRLLNLTYRESSQGAELLGLNCSGSNQLAVKSYLHARQVVQESRQLPLLASLQVRPHQPQGLDTNTLFRVLSSDFVQQSPS